MDVTRTKATCRYCDDWGYEDADDPAPGICPTCFDRRFAEAMTQLAANPTTVEARRLLAWAGMTESAAEEFIETIAAGLS